MGEQLVVHNRLEIAHILSHSNGDIFLIVTVARREHRRGRIFVEQEVDDVEEAAEVAVAILLADGDERRRDAGCDADGVLDVEVLRPETSSACNRLLRDG